MYFDDIRYARQRLSETIVRTKSGEPIYISEIDDNFVCRTVKIRDGESLQVNLEEVDIKPVPLGYVNLARETTYLSRIPLRGYYKQGLGHGNMYCVGKSVTFAGKEFYSTIMNIYPKFSTAVEEVNSLKSKVTSRAFHRHWALNSISLFYKGHVVGDIVNGEAILNSKSSYLKEYLSEVTNNG